MKVRLKRNAKKLGSKFLKDPVFAGREQELKELALFLDEAISGNGKTIFVSGEAGTGKTRLTSEFLSQATQKNTAILSGWCLRDSSSPYFPFIEAFRKYTDFERRANPANLEQEEVRELKELLLNINRGRAGELSSQTWKDIMFDSVGKLLSLISETKPSILFLEDIHWADSASLALLHYISRVLQGQRVLILATFRSEELNADSDGRPHPLLETLRYMNRENLVTELKLRNLSLENVGSVAKSLLGANLDADSLEKLVQESNGNALFVVELIRMLIESKGLVYSNGNWSLADQKLTTPSKIKDVFLQRLSILNFSQRRILDAASVIGEEFQVELLSAVLSLDYLGVLDTLNLISQSTSLIRTDGESYRFNHAKSRDAVYDELAGPLKRGYHIKTAECIESLSDSSLPYSALTFHYTRGGNKDKATDYALLAGKDALAKWSNNEAAEYFSYVLETISSKPEGGYRKIIALEGLADAQFASCNYEEAIKNYQQLTELTLGEDKIRVYRKLMEAIFFKSEPSRLIKTAIEAEKFAGNNRLELARIQVNKGRGYAYLGDLKAGIVEWEAALKVFEEEYALADAAIALVGIGFRGIQVSFDYQKGLSENLRSIALSADTEDIQVKMDALYVTAVAMNMCGLYDEAYNRLNEVSKLLLKMGDFRRLSTIEYIISINSEVKKDFCEAIARNLKSLEYAEKTDAHVSAHSLAHLARIYSIIGEPAKAGYYYERLLALPAETLKERSVHMWSLLTKAVVLTEKKHWAEVNRCFEEISVIKPFGVNAQHLVMMYHAWILAKQGFVKEAESLVKEINAMLEEAASRFAHSGLDAKVMTRSRLQVGQATELRIDFVNAGKKACSILKVEGMLDSNFVTNLPTHLRKQNGDIYLEDGSVNAFAARTIKMEAIPLKPGLFTITPKVVYVDDKGETRILTISTVRITVEPTIYFKKNDTAISVPILADRVSTGTLSLDALLYGGIPKTYALALTSPTDEERLTLLRRFIEEGLRNGEGTFYLTNEIAKKNEMSTREFPLNFYLFVCNPRASSLENLPNLFVLKGVENLTDIDIALTRAFRQLEASGSNSCRACIEIVSDVLLQHHAVTTRKWLRGIVQDLKSKGFTILAAIDPRLHPQEELEAVVGVFDGEIQICEKATSEGTRKVLKIKKLYSQKYLEDELIIKKNDPVIF